MLKDVLFCVVFALGLVFIFIQMIEIGRRKNTEEIELHYDTITGLCKQIKEMKKQGYVVKRIHMNKLTMIKRK